MRITVIGADGQVGAFFLSELAGRHTLSGAGLIPGEHVTLLDIRDATAVNNYLQGTRPDHVILTAAMTHVDKCEEFPAQAEAINVQGTRHVAQACKTMGAGMTFFSTDYVFDGAQGPYTEADPPHPQSVYARTKWEGEKIVAELVPNHLIVRPMFVFSYLPNSMNFFMQVLQRVRNQEPITVPGDQIGNPTHAVNLARAVGELIEQGCTGVYHTAGASRMSKAEFARRIVKALGFDPNVVKSVSTVEFKQKAPRPLNSGLVIEKAQAALRENPFWDLDTALTFTLAQMQQHAGQPKEKAGN